MDSHCAGILTGYEWCSVGDAVVAEKVGLLVHLMSKWWAFSSVLIPNSVPIAAMEKYATE